MTKQNVASSEGTLNAMPSFMKRSRWRGFPKACQLQPFARGKCYKHCWNVEPLTTHLQQTYHCMHHFGVKNIWTYMNPWSMHHATYDALHRCGDPISFLHKALFCSSDSSDAVRSPRVPSYTFAEEWRKTNFSIAHWINLRSSLQPVTATLLNSKKPPLHQIL